jgi:preprotein translocase subunit SecA
MLSTLKRLLGDSNQREVKRLGPLVARINALEPEYERLSDEQLRDKTTEFRGRYLAGEALDSLMPEAFAAVREASRRTLGLRHYDVQLIGGAVLHQGKIAEMRTGEGKTLVATLPAYLNALPDKGVHVVTVNDYLARRDAIWMSPVYERLGLRVGVIQHDLEPRLRKEAYAADITYGTNNEYGFDYLRDNMVWDQQDCVQRPLYYAIVDEIDNILVDEARTPLIISGPAEESTDKYALFARLVPRLKPDEDFFIEEKHRAISLTEDGIGKMERWLGLENIYDPNNYELTHYLDQAIKAQFIYRLDRDYVVKDGEVIIVDEFTGRLMVGRRYSEGLHQAIEAKEGVRVQRENVTLARITFQNYFRLYGRLAGMTGTAATEADEFRRIYNLEVISVPTNQPMIREDDGDLVFKTERAKFDAVVEELEELHKLRRPVLVGTVSIEKSEHLSGLLQRKGVPHQVLNAKQHEREAGIIAQAGRPGAVTIATNMAGRGVDILLGGNPAGLVEEQVAKRAAQGREEVVALGGLHILGTERHEARRIDNQLRGRAGRQGDPGSSRFYVSLEDELMRRFGGGNIAKLMDRFGMEEDVPLEHSWVTKAIANAQTKVEAYNFDIRKHVVEYDDVLNKQREVIYSDRHRVLGDENLREMIEDWVAQEIEELVTTYTTTENDDEWDPQPLVQAFATVVPQAGGLTPEELAELPREEIRTRLIVVAEDAYDDKAEKLGEEDLRRLERWVLLRIIDSWWIQHLTAIDDLREGIGLRAYGQRDPLVEYKVEAANMFEGLLASIRHDVARMIFHLTIVREQPRPAQKMITNMEDEDARQPVRAGQKVGRNDPCPCGSGKKYKKCHGR